MPSSTASTMTDDYPSMLWVAIPPILLLSAYCIRKWYLARRLRIHGIGKGAPGFQTNVRRIRVTPEIAARIQRGEEVSAEEIEAALNKANEEKASNHKKKDDPVENEWLPDSVTGPKKKGKGKKR